MTLDKLRTVSGRRLRSEALVETETPIPYDAAAMPGAIALGTDGKIYVSIKSNAQQPYNWYPLVFTGSDDVTQLPGGLFVSGGLVPRNDVTGVGTPIFQVEGVSPPPGSPNAGFGDSSLALIRHAEGPQQPSLHLCKTRGNATGSSALIAEADRLGSVSFQGADGTRFVVGAVIRGIVDGATGNLQMPGRLDFFVTPPGPQTQVPGGGTDFTVLRVRLNSEGNLLIGNTTGTERLSVTGNIQLTEPTDTLKVGANTVVGARKTGWTAPTGTATRTTFATSTVTTAQLAERVKALIDDLTAHGLIGA